MFKQLLSPQFNPSALEETIEHRSDLKLSNISTVICLMLFLFNTFISKSPYYSQLYIFTISITLKLQFFNLALHFRIGPFENLKTYFMFITEHLAQCLTLGGFQSMSPDMTLFAYHGVYLLTPMTLFWTAFMQEKSLKSISQKVVSLRSVVSVNFNQSKAWKSHLRQHLRLILDLRLFVKSTPGSLFFLLNAAFLTEKQRIPIL